MLIEIYLSNSEKVILSCHDQGTWDDIINSLENHLNDPLKFRHDVGIEYIAMKGAVIKFYTVNIFIKNLTKKIELLPLKERPKHV